MKQFSLEEYLKDPSRKVVTRDGRAVKIHCTNYYANQTIIAEIEGLGVSYAFNIDGTFSYGNSPNDLFFAPEKHEGWVNVYRTQGKLGCVFIYDSEKEARRNGGETAIATVKIEWKE